MSKESIKRQIEGYKRDIDRQKSSITNCREDMAKIRIRKSRDAETYSRRLTTANSQLKNIVYVLKKREIGIVTREIFKEKEIKFLSAEKKVKIIEKI